MLIFLFFVRSFAELTLNVFEYFRKCPHKPCSVHSSVHKQQYIISMQSIDDSPQTLNRRDLKAIDSLFDKANKFQENHEKLQNQDLSNKIKLNVPLQITYIGLEPIKNSPSLMAKIYLINIGRHDYLILRKNKSNSIIKNPSSTQIDDGAPSTTSDHDNNFNRIYNESFIADTETLILVGNKVFWEHITRDQVNKYYSRYELDLEHFLYTLSLLTCKDYLLKKEMTKSEAKRICQEDLTSDFFTEDMVFIVVRVGEKTELNSKSLGVNINSIQFPQEQDDKSSSSNKSSKIYDEEVRENPSSSAYSSLPSLMGGDIRSIKYEQKKNPLIGTYAIIPSKLMKDKKKF